MTTYKSDFIRILNERNFIHQCTDIVALDDKVSKEVIVAYIGFDATAASLHVGSLLPIMMLRWLQNTGHKPIILIGGGTTKVGDPSGKDESRKMLTATDIAENIEGIKRVFSRYLTFGDGPIDAIIINNASWLDNLNYIGFLRDYGPHFTINRMMSFDSVKRRLEREQPLTFLEFNYMILQAYDFVELARHHNCVLQMGGSDQWGNIVNGVELGRRISNKQLYGLTSPLLTTSSGTKMGKTVSGAIWLNADMSTSYDYWQYWRNTEDADVGRFLRLFTELPLDEIVRLEVLSGIEINEAKKILANEATKLCHGDAVAVEVAEIARKTFEEGILATGLPTIEIPSKELNNGLPVFRLFVHAGLVSSYSEARRLIKGGGGKVNDQEISDETRLLTATDITDNGVIKLSVGKKKHALIKPV